MKKLVINNVEYEIIKNYNDAIVEEEIKERLTEYFDDFDYVVGDWSYGKLRLKGFNESTNKNIKNINDIKNLDEYIHNYCSYGCKYFVLKRD